MRITLAVLMCLAMAGCEDVYNWNDDEIRNSDPFDGEAILADGSGHSVVWKDLGPTLRAYSLRDQHNRSEQLKKAFNHCVGIEWVHLEGKYGVHIARAASYEWEEIEPCVLAMLLTYKEATP